MAKPNSLTTIIRRRLARIIEPLPPPDEVWCIDCIINEGWTFPLPAHMALHHLERHRDNEKGVYVNIIGRALPRQEGEQS